MTKIINDQLKQENVLQQHGSCIRVRSFLRIGNLNQCLYKRKTWKDELITIMLQGRK